MTTEKRDKLIIFAQWGIILSNIHWIIDDFMAIEEPILTILNVSSGILMGAAGVIIIYAYVDKRREKKRNEKQQ